ncbi:MAG: DUF4878 domain-containing protein [Bacteroidales bacterium]|nr:DUF4878 domain-containing protein [Bacteroidales bacterium]
MKKLVIVLAVIAMAFAMSSCDKNGGKTPTDATKAYYDCLKKGDFKGAVKSTYKFNKEMTADEQKKAEESIDALAEKISLGMNMRGGIKDYTVSDEAIDGEMASVKVKITYGDGGEDEQNEQLKKIGDKWFIFDGENVENPNDNMFGDMNLDEETTDEEPAGEEVADEEIADEE